MAPDGLMLPVSLVCFEDKSKFSATQHLSAARSKRFNPPAAKSEGEAWVVRPPDFSPKLYKSLAAPQRKGEKRVAVPQQRESPRRRRVRLPELSHPSHQREDRLTFITTFRPPDALASELKFVRTGKFPSAPYENPKPHDFRPLDEELPDVITTQDKDPGNMHLKLKHLDIFRTTRSNLSFSPRGTEPRMDTSKTPEPLWDAGLVLPKSPWPPKSASYTRHRRSRGAYDAFLDRVEEKLSRLWQNKTSG